MFNLIWFLWIVFTIVLSQGIWLQLFPKIMSKRLARVFVYGKVQEKYRNYNIVDKLQVPKRWFWHFYVSAVVTDAIAMAVVYRLYVLNVPIPDYIKYMFQIVIPDQHVTISALTAFIAVALTLFHTTRRLLESLFVSSYSSSTIHVAHYVGGYWFYFTVMVTLLSEAPGFTDDRIADTDLSLTFDSLRWHHIAGSILFLYACRKQYTAHKIFANLRKDSSGKIKTYQHMIPSGDWFQYISCPHYLAEMMIYASLMLVLGFDHIGGWFILTWVVVSHVLLSLQSHQWYLQKFKQYPKKRKAVIPFLL